MLDIGINQRTMIVPHRLHHRVAIVDWSARKRGNVIVIGLRFCESWKIFRGGLIAKTSVNTMTPQLCPKPICCYCPAFCQVIYVQQHMCS